MHAGFFHIAIDFNLIFEVLKFLRKLLLNWM